jgi:hypothetical protein
MAVLSKEEIYRAHQSTSWNEDPLFDVAMGHFQSQAPNKYVERYKMISRDQSPKDLQEEISGVWLTWLYEMEHDVRCIINIT